MSDSSHAADHHDSHGHHDGEFSHPAPLSMLFTVFFALVALTFLTVWQSTQTMIDFGAAELWVTLFIATVKAGLVIFFFMHMLWDKPLNGILFFSSLIFVALFLGFTLMDAEGYNRTKEDKDTLAESLPPMVAVEKGPAEQK
jgi:cytochrome c oxidase subunit IV